MKTDIDKTKPKIRLTWKKDAPLKKKKEKVKAVWVRPKYVPNDYVKRLYVELRLTQSEVWHNLDTFS